MLRDPDGLSRQGTVDVPEGFIPGDYIVGQRLKNLLAGPVMSRQAYLRVNMTRIDCALERGDRAQFERLAGERRYIGLEWPD